MDTYHIGIISVKVKKGSEKCRNKENIICLGSRAKKNLYLFSERGRTTNKGYEYVMTDELRAVSFKYDMGEEI
mgnify:CR=1 FL=1